MIPYIVQLFPPEIKTYVELFGGSGAVLLGMQPKAGRLDIYNDSDSDLSNLFLCVRDRLVELMAELKFLPSTPALYLSCFSISWPMKKFSGSFIIGISSWSRSCWKIESILPKSRRKNCVPSLTSELRCLTFKERPCFTNVFGGASAAR